MLVPRQILCDNIRLPKFMEMPLMKKFLRLALLAGVTATAGLLSAAGMWGRFFTPSTTNAAPRVEVRSSLQTNRVTTATISVTRDGVYNDKDHLCRYIVTFGTLPKNFITKNEARRLGWNGGPLEPYAPGKSIGGDRYGNYERLLPNGRYRECDVDTLRRPRGAKRIVYSDDRRVYYSDDHYRSFKRLH